MPVLVPGAVSVLSLELKLFYHISLIISLLVLLFFPLLSICPLLLGVPAQSRREPQLLQLRSRHLL